MRQLVCFSTATDTRLDAVTLAGILVVSRDRNRRDQIGGLLLAGGHRFLHILEGESGAVNAVLTRIQRDPRHIGFTILIDRIYRKRVFHDWSMLLCEAPSKGDYATLGDMIGHLQQAVRDDSVRRQINCLARSFVVAPDPFLPLRWTSASDYHSNLTLDRRH
jgi:Sensors of blue-light using FAD